MINILIVEDDTALNRLMATVLRQQGYQVCAASNGREALEWMDRQKIDLVVSDIMMPGMDGYELVEQVRAQGSTVPILFVTAKGSIMDKSRGFTAGVDDYMVKPIDIKEMVLRVAALLRRSKIANENILRIGQTTLDTHQMTVSVGDETIVLPQKEFQLLFKLLSYPGRIFTRMDIMDDIWGYDSESDDKTINVHVSKLRARFENNADFSIETVRGLGYKAVLK